MRKAIYKINKFFSECTGYLLFLVTVISCADVFLRLSGIMIYGPTELSMFLVISSVYLGLAYCEELDNHVRITVAIGRLSPPKQAFCRMLSDILSIIIVAIAVYACTESAWGAYTDRDVVMASHIALPTWPVRMAMAFGLLLYGIQLFVSLDKDYTLFVAASKAAKQSQSARS